MIAGVFRSPRTPRGAFLAAAVLLAAAPAVAERLPIRSYTTEEGLPHNRIKRITGDSHGFVWLSTTEGLSRFDGHAFVSYGTAQGLPVPSVNDLLEIEGKGYWVATNGGGVAFLDPDGRGPGRFTVTRVGDDPAASRVNVLFRDRAGRLWAGSDGGLFRRASAEPVPAGTFALVPLGLPGRPDAVVQVWALAEDGAGTVWAGTKYGLVGLTPEGEVLHRPIAARESDHVMAVLADDDGRIWVGHETAGLLAYDASVLRAGGPPARRYPGPETAGGPAADRVNALHRSGEVLFVATQGGLWELRPGGVGGRSARGAPDGPGDGSVRGFTTAHGLSENMVTALAEGRDGSLWLGTAAAGAMRLTRDGFVTYREEDGLGHTVSGIFERSNGELCAVSSGWLVSRFDGRRFTSVRPRLPATLPPSRWRFFQSVLEDREGEWWFATGEGLARFPKPGALEDLERRPPSAFYTTRDGLASDDVSRLHQDAAGDLWIGSFTPVADGLVRWERATGRFHRYGRTHGLPALISVSAFCQGPGGSLWIAFREGGLARYRDGTFRPLAPADGLPDAPVIALLADPSGVLFMTTAGSGLWRLEDPEGERPRAARHGAAGGFEPYYLSGLTRDREGRLYVGTSRDVRRLDPATGSVERYSAGHGVVSSEVLAAHCDRSGALWFATWRGLSRYLPVPDGITRPPSVRIGAVSVSGVPRAVSDLGANQVALGELAPSAGFVQIEFFSLGAGVGDAVQYQHLLEGADRDWSPPGAQRSILYANLAAGRYTFRVRAVDARGLSSTSPASVSFTVLPPIWRRWWFLVSAALLLASFGYGADHARSARRLGIERVRTRIATDLHDDIGASLSRIAVLTEVLKKKVGPEHQERLSDIAQLARELVGSMSDIVWATDPRRDDLKSVTRRLRAFAADVLEARGIAFDCRVAPECEDLELGPESRRQLYLILKEAVSNVARHSGATDARLRLSREGRYLAAELSDDGRGVPGPLGSGFTHGTVHGVPNMQRRAEAAGGTFRMSSSPGEGTVVKVRLPVKKV